MGQGDTQIRSPTVLHRDRAGQKHPLALICPGGEHQIVGSLGVIKLDAVGLELLVQVVQAAQLLLRPLHAPLGEIGGLDALHFLLNLHHGLEVGHGDGGAVHPDDHVGVVVPLLQHGEQLGQVGLALPAGQSQAPVGGAAGVGQQAILVQEGDDFQHVPAVHRLPQHRHHRGGGCLGGRAHAEEAPDGREKPAGLLRAPGPAVLGQLRGLRLRLLRGLRLRRGLLLRDRRGRPALQDRLQRRRGHVLSVHLELPIGHRGIVRQQPQRFQAVQRRLQLTYGAGAAVHRHIAAGQRPGLRDGQGAALLLNGDLAAPVGEHVAVLVDEAILPQQLHGLLGGLFISPERGQLPQDLLILVGRVVPQGGVGRRGQGAHEHDGGHEPRQPAFPSFSHKTLPSIAYTGVLMPCTGSAPARASAGIPGPGFRLSAPRRCAPRCGSCPY